MAADAPHGDLDRGQRLVTVADVRTGERSLRPRPRPRPPGRHPGRAGTPRSRVGHGHEAVQPPPPPGPLPPPPLDPHLDRAGQRAYAEGQPRHGLPTRRDPSRTSPNPVARNHLAGEHTFDVGYGRVCEHSLPGLALGPARRRWCGRAGQHRASHTAGSRSVAGHPPGLGEWRRRAVRALARGGAVACRATGHVRPGGRRAPAAELLRRGCAAARRGVGAGHRALDAHYSPELGEPFRTAGLCLYRDGRDSVAWHGDTIGRGSTEDTAVAIVSLGSPRALLLRPRGGGGSTLRYEVGHGDLIVMGGSAQRTWEHAVPKTARPTGPRISVQFRPRGVR